MGYPVLYDIAYSYTGFQQSQGNNSFPGTQLDNDLAGLQDSVSSLALFVEQTIRSDGKIANGLVTYDSLSSDVQTAGLAPSFAWATATQYFANAGVLINNNFYRATVSHTSGVFATDLAAGKWVFVSTLLQGPQGIQGPPGTPVSTIAALRALAPGIYPGVHVLGYYAAGDGGGGLFVWSSAASGADNGGTIIQPTLGGVGRWVRQMPFLNIASPRMFGARGDGTNDATFVQTAMDTLYALGGGTLWHDSVYTVGAAGVLHSNGFSVIDWKNGVNLDGPGGLKLANNVNVANSVFTASFAGTTMTVSAMTSGSIVAGQFISAVGSAPVTQVVTQLGGTPNGVGTYQTTTTNALGATTVKGINRMVELIGNYSSSPVAGINDTTCRNILLDYNGVNNCASGTIWSFNSVVSVQTCDGLVFDSVRFRNNCGSNSIVLGTYQTTLTAFRCRISNCSFENDGDRINAVSVDYSTIFAVGSHIDIVGNTFGIGPTLNGVAWEVYGSDININGNTVSGYWGVANVVAIANQTTQNVSITGNTVQDCSVGATLWTLASTSKLRGINISGNTLVANVSAAGGPYMVNGISAVTTGSELRDILIANNVWQNTNLADTARSTAGISLAAVVTAKITGNLVNGIPGPGVYIERSIDPTSITITGNTLLNTGYTATAASKTGITLVASGTAGSLLIQGNVIHPFAGYTLTTGIKNALSVSSGKIRNNLIVSATTPVANTGAGVTVDDVTVSDAAFTLQDDADATKQVQFQLSGVTTGQTRVLSVPDATTTLLGTNSAGQLPATATNDSAAAGKLGEYVEGVLVAGSATALTNATSKTVISISLPAGDWDVDAIGSFVFAATTSATLTQASISLVNNTLDVTPGRDTCMLYNGVVPNSGHISQPIPNYRLSLNATTTVYLVVNAAFTASTLTAYGIIRARRVR